MIIVKQCKLRSIHIIFKKVQFFIFKFVKANFLRVTKIQNFNDTTSIIYRKNTHIKSVHDNNPNTILFEISK